MSFINCHKIKELKDKEQQSKKKGFGACLIENIKKLRRKNLIWQKEKFSIFGEEMPPHLIVLGFSGICAVGAVLLFDIFDPLSPLNIKYTTLNAKYYSEGECVDVTRDQPFNLDNNYSFLNDMKTGEYDSIVVSTKYTFVFGNNEEEPYYAILKDSAGLFVLSERD